jgi:hypothetical protein
MEMDLDQAFIAHGEQAVPFELARYVPVDLIL